MPAMDGKTMEGNVGKTGEKESETGRGKEQRGNFGHGQNR